MPRGMKGIGEGEFYHLLERTKQSNMFLKIYVTIFDKFV